SGAAVGAGIGSAMATMACKARRETTARRANIVDGEITEEKVVIKTIFYTGNSGCAEVVPRGALAERIPSRSHSVLRIHSLEYGLSGDSTIITQASTSSIIPRHGQDGSTERSGEWKRFRVGIKKAR
ncbi:15974_t:CDS:2, partial [Acaulospora colombiana]